jgi:tetratricopeptide (TPR) repeat protein
MIFPNQQKALNCILNMFLNQTDNLITCCEMMKRIVKIYALASLLLVPFITKSQTLDEAIKHLDAERFTAASKAFNQLAETSPSPLNLFYKGYGILRSPDGLTSENIKAAQSAFEAGNALDKKGDPMNQVGLGMVKLASKDLAGAKIIFEEVKKATKLKNSDILYRIAEAYTMFPGATDAGEAILNINMALEKSKAKDNPEYYIVKADAYMLKNEGGEAMNALTNAERVGKKPGKTYERMSRVWLQGRNYREANDAINKGLSADPTHAPIHKYHSSYLQTMGKYKESAEAAGNYLKNSDGDSKAKLRYAKLAFVAKDFENVKKIINEIKGTNPDPYLLRMSGIMNFEEKKPLEAIDDLTKFIKAAPADESPAIDYGYIGRSYMILPGEGDEKIKNDSLGVWNIEKAIQLGDTTFNYYQDLATTFTKNKNWAKAALFYEKAALAKKNANAADYAPAAIYYNAAKNYDKAETYINKALELYKDAWPAGYALSARNQMAKNAADSTFTANFGAASVWDKYFTLLGDAGKAAPANKRNVVDGLRYLAGWEFQVNKNLAKGVTYIEELLKYDPTNTDAQKMLEAMKGMNTPVTPAAPTPPIKNN